MKIVKHLNWNRTMNVRPKLESARDDFRNVCVIVCCYMGASNRLQQRNDNETTKNEIERKKETRNTTTNQKPHTHFPSHPKTTVTIAKQIGFISRYNYYGKH